jgi:hypothetical protein
MKKEDIDKIKFKALNWYCHDCTNGLPIRWVDFAISKMVTEKSDPATERLKELIDLVIYETEKQLTEVF